MSSSFSWTNLFKSSTSRLLCLSHPTLETLNQVNNFHLSLCATESCDTKSILFCDPGVHPFATKPLTTKSLAHKPKQVCMYLQEEPSAPPSDEPSGDTDEATNPDEFTLVNAHCTYRFL